MLRRLDDRPPVPASQYPGATTAVFLGLSSEGYWLEAAAFTSFRTSYKSPREGLAAVSEALEGQPRERFTALRLSAK